MKKHRKILPVCVVAIVLLVLPGGCNTFTNLTVRYDKKTNFDLYKTYAWLPDADKSGNNDFDNDFIRQRIRNYIGHCMDERQYVADTLHPDLLVRVKWMAEARELSMPMPPARPYYYNSLYYNDPFTIRMSQRGKIDYTNRYSVIPETKQPYYHNGVEVILIDVKSKEVIWDGFTSDDIYDPKMIDRELHPSIHKMMKRLPDSQ